MIYIQIKIYLHQLKLLCESLLSEIEDLEKENEILLSKLKLKKKKRNLTEEISSDDDNESLYLKSKHFYLEKNSNKDNKDNEEYNELKLVLKNTLLILKKYEEQNLKLSDGEKKLKNLLVKKEKEFLEKEIN